MSDGDRTHRREVDVGGRQEHGTETTGPGREEAEPGPAQLVPEDERRDPVNAPHDAAPDMNEIDPGDGPGATPGE